EPEPEWKERLTAEIDVIVAAPGGFVVVYQRELAFCERKRDRQTAGRIVVAEQHIDDRVAALLSRIPCIEHGADGVDPARHRDRAPADEYNYDGLARRRGLPNELFLMPRQRERCAVAELAFLDPRDDDRDVARARGFDGGCNLRARVPGDAGVPD